MSSSSSSDDDDKHLTKEQRKQKKQEKKRAKEARRNVKRDGLHKTTKNALSKLHEVGKSIFVQSLSSSTTKTAAGPLTTANPSTTSAAAPRNPLYIPIATPILRVMRTHDVDESLPAYKSHGIIKVVEGEMVDLLQGTPQTGLPPPYNEYIMVKTSAGKVGKVGRLCFEQ